ncbi:MAG: hypothetical protein GX862_01435 [Leucobacter sp.]|jgi:hypothetical protein|nr:hypothetical protein [Leucobacter sp.]
MSNALTTLLSEAPTPDSSPVMMIDAAQYAQRVLLQDSAVPWHDATEYSNHLGQAQALLKPAVAFIPLDRMLVSEMQANTELCEAMGARSRTGYAAKTLLADEAIRQKAFNIVATAVKTQREPVVLQLPSPHALLTMTDRVVDPASTTEFDDDQAESTAIYLADWLRTFADLDITGIIFDVRARSEPIGSYQPIFNTAEHYQWPIGRRRANEVQFVSPDTVVQVADWSELGSISGPGVYFTEVPVDAVPEDVLSQLAALRGGA